MNQVEHRPFYYDAFISYRHLPFDKALAKKLHTLLETYRLPSMLEAKGFPHRLRRVFRDEDELPTAGILSDSIRHALEESGWLIVVCTQDTPLSHYILLEIQIFIGLGKADRIILLLAKGDPEQSVPDIVRKISGFESRILDIRSPKTNQTMRLLEHVIPRIIACCLGCSENDLRREKARQNHRWFIIGSFVVVAVLVLTGLFCYSQWCIADQARQRAKVEKDAMMAVIQSLTYDLPEKMHDISFTYPLVAEVLEQNLKTLDKIIDLNGSSYETSREKAQNYEKLQSAWDVLGDYNKACVFATKGLGLYQFLAKKTSNIYAQMDLANSYNDLGVVYLNRGDHDKAISNYQKALTIWSKLAECKSKQIVCENVACSFNNLGIAYDKKGNYVEALRNYRKALSMRVQLANARRNKTTLSDLRDIYNNMGGFYLGLSDYDDAINNYQEALVIQKDLSEDKHNKRMQSDLAGNYFNLGLAYFGKGLYEKCLEEYQKALVIREALAEDKTNKSEQSDLANTYTGFGDYFYSKMNYNEAMNYYQKTINIQKQLAQDKTNKTAQSCLAHGYYRIGLTYSKRCAYGEAIISYQKALTIHKELAKDATNLDAKVGLANCYRELGNAYFSMGVWENSIVNYRNYLPIREVLTRKSTRNIVQITDDWEVSQKMSMACKEIGDYKNAKKYEDIFLK